MLTRRNIFLVLATTTFLALSQQNAGGGGGTVVHAFVMSPAIQMVSPFVSTTMGKVGSVSIRSTVDLPVRILVSSPLHSTSAPAAPVTTGATATTTTTSATSTPPATTTVTKQPLPPLTPLGNRRLAVSMAFLTGWADIALNARVATFCTMMSGNTLWFGRSLIQRKPLDGIYYLSVIAAYILGLAAYHKEKRRDPASSSILLQTAKVTMPMFVLADYLLKRACWIQTAGVSAIASIPVRARFAPALLLSFAFAWVNSIGTDIAGQATSVITGHMTRCTNQFMDNFTPATTTTTDASGSTPVPSFWERLAKRNPFWTSLYVILGFGGGATWANFLKANPQWWMHQPNTMGDFAWIGVLFGAMFWWKERVARPKGDE